MARKVYYGTCPASPDNSSGVGAGEESSTYHVYIRDIDVSAEGFKLEEGDLLVVFFGVQNKIENPSIALYAADTNEQISVIDDEGKFIKTWDVEAEAVDAWGVGETVIFTYTQRGNEYSDGSYHWALVNGVHASQDVYGDTKLYDLDMTSDDPEEPIFPDWIIGEIGAEETDTTTALAPNMLKKLYRLLTQSSPEGEGLIWTSAAGGTQEPLGTLKLTNGGDAVNITYPLTAIVEAVKNLVPEKTHTGQLENNGNGGGDGHETDPSAPFITQYIPSNTYIKEDFSVPAGLHFETGSGLNYTYLNNNQERQYIPRIVLNDASDKIAIGASDGDTLSGIVLGKDTEVSGNLLPTKRIINHISGTVSSIPTPPAAVDTVGITTNGQIREKNQLLKDRYGPLYEIEMIRHYPGVDGNGVIKANKNSGHLHPSVITQTHPSNEWTAIGIVGYNVNYYQAAGAKGDDAYYANVWECYLKDSSQIEYSIFNFRNTDIKVFIDIYVLYMKNI